MAGPLDYLRKQNSMMPPNLAAAAQRNLANADRSINQFNVTGKSFGVTQTPVAAAMQATQQPLQPASWIMNNPPDTSLGAQPLPQLNTTVQGQQSPSSASASAGGSDWRFKDFHDMYKASNPTLAVLSPQATANFQKQYGWGGATNASN